MNIIKRNLAFLLAALLFISSSYAGEIDKTKPYEMMSLVSESLFERLKSEREEIRENPELLKTVVEEELMPYIHTRYAALKVLARHLNKKKDKEEVKAEVKTFTDAFEHYLVTSYAQVLTLYTDQTIEFGPKAEIKETQRISTVKVAVLDPPRPDIKLEFKLRKDKSSGEWLAFDLTAEGISLLSSVKSEWNTKLRKEGIPAVSEQLMELSKRPIRFEGAVQ
jgi:phospholipid transport system substrate-binding protein